jgi:ABC-2 type transport system permease protein
MKLAHTAFGETHAAGAEGASPAERQTRPLYWSIRRELWENRSTYVAPLVVAAFALLGFLISALAPPDRARRMPLLDPAARGVIVMPYRLVALLMILTVAIVGGFYCLEALSGERRDRSILFWKSMPVSDASTILAKASVPLVVMPLFAFWVVVATHLAMLLLSGAFLTMRGESAVELWKLLPLPGMTVALLYALAAAALWHAPIYAALLLVSGWAPRAAVIWATLPVLAMGVLETIAFGTSHVSGFVRYRLTGWISEGFNRSPAGLLPIDPLAALAPGRLFGAPGLWIGLVFAGAFLYAAARLRRYRDPA